jgi:putative peptide zinc metalloprotease protein
VFAPVVLKAHQAEDVYTAAPGVLKSIDVEPGQRVEIGQRIVTLGNLDNALRIEKLKGQIRQYEAQIEDLESMSLSETDAADQREQAAEALTATREQLAQAEKDAARLTITAPRAGVVLPPPYKAPRKGNQHDLGEWFGSPLDEKNLGATLDASTQVCQIVDPDQLEAQLVIDETNAFDVFDGQRVELMFKQSTDFTFASTLHKVSQEGMETTPPRLSSLTGGPVATKMDDSGVPRPMTTQISADALLTMHPGMPPEAIEAHRLLRVGLTGKAKIHTKDRTLGYRLYRYAARTFNFDL